MFNLTLKELRAIDNVEESDLKSSISNKENLLKTPVIPWIAKWFKLPSIHPTSAKRLPHQQSIFFRKAHLKAWWKNSAWNSILESYNKEDWLRLFCSVWKICNGSIFVFKKQCFFNLKIPHTGDKASLDRCG